VLRIRSLQRVAQVTVAAYLGHSDLSTVSRYAHVAEDELHEPAGALAALSATDAAASLGAAARNVAGQSPGARAERFDEFRATRPNRKSAVTRAFSVAGL
jgi:hypothetical protein